MPSPAPVRQAAERAGRWAERLAAWRLLVAGYRVVARNYRCPAGEIDLVVRRGRILVFVEVKTRGVLADAAEAIRLGQQRRIRNAAAAFLVRYPHLGACDLRFDAVLIAPGRLPRHIPDAWCDSDSWTR
jgi:putative endonuclease